jgi:hypothetical protein
MLREEIADSFHLFPRILSEMYENISPVALMMEAQSTFETSVNFYQTSRRSNPEGSHFHFLRVRV